MRALNRLQAFWANTLLGGPAGYQVGTFSAMAVCGWTLSLGSYAWEVAIIALARLSVPSLDHPGSCMLEVAHTFNGPSWLTSLLGCMCAQGIPTIARTGFSEQLIEGARCDRLCHKFRLSRYRWDCVKPILLGIDAAKFARKVTRVLPTFGVAITILILRLQKLPMCWLNAPCKPGMWKFFRCWSLPRLTGR